jgi:hypothetical protein
MEMRALRLIEMQALMRRRVEQEQSEIMGMGERSYRKMSRWCDRMRDDAEKGAVKKKADAWGTHLKSVATWKHKFREFYWAAKSRRDDVNRKVGRHSVSIHSVLPVIYCALTVLVGLQ